MPSANSNSNLDMSSGKTPLEEIKPSSTISKPKVATTIKTNRPIKDDLFEAIAPKSASPMIIATQTGKKKLMGSLGVVSLVLFLVALGVLGYLFREYNSVKQILANVESQKSVSATKQPVSGSPEDMFAKHIIVPKDSNLHMTVIQSDTDLRHAQQIYSAAKYGDELVQLNGIEFVYDPIADIIEAAKTFSGQAASSTTTTLVATSSPSAVNTLSIEIRNGSGVSGLASKTASALKTNSQFNVVKTGNAANNNYAHTVVVNLSTKDISSLTSQLKATAVTALPVGETKSSADVLVILGKQ